MKQSHESFARFTLARLGLVGAFLSAAALTVTAQSATSGSSSSQGAVRSSERSAVAAKKETTHLTKADKKFVEKFTKSNHREMALAQLGVQRATHPEVKVFAQRLVSEHEMMTSEFMATVHSEGIGSSTASLRKPTESPEASSATGDAGARDLDLNGQENAARKKAGKDAAGNGALSASSGMSGSAMATTPDMSDDRYVRALMNEKTGEDFDEEFVERMVKEHEQAVKLLEKVIEGDDHSQNIRAFANKHLPALREHLREAKRLEEVLD